MDNIPMKIQGITIIFTCLIQGLYSADPVHTLVPLEQELVEKIFTNYNPVIRPVLDPSDSVQVYVSMAISKLDELSMKEEKLTISGWLTVEWQDERLVWDPAMHNNITSIVVTPSMIWLPAFTLENTLNPVVYTREHYEFFRVEVDHNGLCSWEPGGRFISKCRIQIQDYPFDEQTCEMVFSNWVYTGDKVNLTLAEDAQDTLLEVYNENGEWEFTSFNMSRREFVYECCPYPYPEIEFRFHFRRKSLYYTMNILVPSVMLSLLVLMVFRLPPESGEKMSMGVTLLLSYSVFLLMVSDNVPNTSQGVPIIVVYLLFSMGVTCVSVLIEVLVLMAHHSNSIKGPPFFLRRMAAKLIKHAGPTSDILQNVALPNGTDTGPTLRELFERLPQNGNIVPGGINISPEAHYKGDDVLKVLSAIRRELEGSRQREEKGEKVSTILTQWRAVALAVDLVFFWVIFFVHVFGTVLILAVLPHISNVEPDTL